MKGKGKQFDLQPFKELNCGFIIHHQLEGFYCLLSNYELETYRST